MTLCVDTNSFLDYYRNRKKKMSLKIKMYNKHISLSITFPSGYNLGKRTNINKTILKRKQTRVSPKW